MKHIFELQRYISIINCKSIIVQFMTMQEKQILARDFEIQKENWQLTMHFSEII